MLDPAMMVVELWKMRQAVRTGMARATVSWFTDTMRPPRNRTSLSSKKVRHCGPSRDKSGRKILPHREVLGPAGLVKKTLQARERQRVRLQGTSNIIFIFISSDNIIYLQR
jgi:hypothetical protein